MKLDKSSITLIILIIVFLGTALVGILTSPAHAQVNASYAQVTKGITQYFKMDTSYGDDIFNGMLHYGTNKDKQVSLLISETHGNVKQVMIVFMEGSPISYSGMDSQKYAQLADESFKVVIDNIFYNCNPNNPHENILRRTTLWIKLRRNDLMGFNVKSGKRYTKTFNGRVVQVYSVFMPQLKRGFNVVSIT